MEHPAELYRALGYQRMALLGGVRQHNEQAIGFYKRFGFRTAAEFAHQSAELPYDSQSVTRKSFFTSSPMTKKSNSYYILQEQIPLEIGTDNLMMAGHYTTALSTNLKYPRKRCYTF